MATTFSISMRDYNGQTGTFGASAPATDETSLIANLSALTALRNAVTGITDGLAVRQQLNLVTVSASPSAKASESDSKRGQKWLVTAYDNTATLGTVANPSYFKVFSYEIPTADFDMRENNDNVVYSDGNMRVTGASATAMQAFVDAFQAFVKSPTGGDLVITEIRGKTTSV